MTLKKYLQQFTKEQLIEQINELHKKYKEVKDYYSFCLNPDEKKTVEKYKAIIYESFYNSMEGMFENACVFIRKNNLENLLRKRCKKLMEDSSDIGWGFHDFLSDAYYEFFEDNN